MKKSSSTAAPESTGTSESAPAKRTRKRRTQSAEVRVIRKDGTPVALVHSLTDQDAIESVTGKYTAEVVNTLQAFTIGKEFGLDLVSTLPQTED